MIILLCTSYLKPHVLSKRIHYLYSNRKINCVTDNVLKAGSFNEIEIFHPHFGGEFLATTLTGIAVWFVSFYVVLWTMLPMLQWKYNGVGYLMEPHWNCKTNISRHDYFFALREDLKETSKTCSIWGPRGDKSTVSSVVTPCSSEGRIASIFRVKK
jgi:hypothetical protein